MKEMDFERAERKESIDRLEKKIDSLEHSIMENLQQRMGSIEGELKGMRSTLKAIEQWFISNTFPGK
jgi:prefoldin subunit 5